MLYSGRNGDLLFSLTISESLNLSKTSETVFVWKRRLYYPFPINTHFEWPIRPPRWPRPPRPPNPHQHWTSPTRISSVTKRTFSTLRDVEQFHDVEFANESSSKIFRPWTWKPQRISSWIRNRRRQIWNWRGLNPFFSLFSFKKASLWFISIFKQLYRNQWLDNKLIFVSSANKIGSKIVKIIGQNMIINAI